MKYFTFFVLILITSYLFSQKNIQLIENKNNKTSLQFTNSQFTTEFQEIESTQYLNFKNQYKHLLLEKGNPELPFFAESVIIPNKGKSFVNVTFSEFEIIENVHILPSKGNLKRNIDPANIPFVFSETYQQNKFFPEKIASLEQTYNLRSIRGQVVRFYPFQYNPVTKQLKIYKNIQIEIYTDQSQSGENELTSETISQADIRDFKEIFINSPLLEKYNAVSDNGDLLILCPTNYIDSLQKYVAWKIKKGIQTKLVSIAETGATVSSVKTLIQEEYGLNPNLKYVLLIGDHQQIPAHSYGTTFDNEELISDSYYGQLVGNDFFPELFVGRFSGTTANISTMISRAMEYEINPASGDWMTKAIGLGSSEGNGYGDEGQADWAHLRGIRNQLLDFGYTRVHEFYDGTRGQDDASGNPNASIISAAVNEGVGLFNYTGHGDINTCITGNFGSTQINNATNNGFYPFVVSVACNNGTFIYGNCISESWLKATKNGTPSGAIAACGSSILMAWAPPMETQDEMANLITKQNPDNIKQTLGGLFYNAQMSMLENYGSEGREVMQTWIFFGDPSIDFRSKLTQNLTVNFDTCYTNNSSISFTSSEDDVLISLTQNQTILAKGKTINGSLNLTPLNVNENEEITVVCSKPNYKPQISTINQTCNSTSEPKSSIIIYPSPVDSKLNLNLGKTIQFLAYEIYDLNGKIVANYENLNFNNFKTEIDVTNLEDGLYTIFVDLGETVEKLKFVVLK